MNSIIFSLNTHGIFLLIAVVLVYELFIENNNEVVWHSLFAMFAAFIISIFLKELYVIPRPFMIDESQAQAGLAVLSSFPSTHTAVSFALAATITLHQKKFGVLVFMLSAFVALGRVVANVHYPVDIVVGILVGILSGVFFDTLHFGAKRKK